MSDVMLLGVLRMPIECWIENCVDQQQRHLRYLEAALRIEDDQKYIEKLEDVVLYLGSGLFRTGIPLLEFTGQDSQWCQEFEDLMYQLYQRKFEDHD